MTKTKVKAKGTSTGSGMGKPTVCAYCRTYDTCYIHGRRYLCVTCGIAETGITPTP